MARRDKFFWGIATGLVLMLFGVLVTASALPIFSHTIDTPQWINQSENIVNSAINLDQTHQRADWLVPMTMDQNVSVVATSTGNFNFSIVSYVGNGHDSHPNEPDATYVALVDTSLVNETWKSQDRVPESTDYFVVVQVGSNVSATPLTININVTKIWKELQAVTVTAPDLVPLTDPALRYVGLGVISAGAIMATLFTYLKRRHRQRIRNTNR